jgi:hypothetical protein
MHIFLAIVAAGVTLYLLRNWWERLQYRREIRHVERALNPPPVRPPAEPLPKMPMSHWPGTIAIGTAMGIILGIMKMKFGF